MKRYFYRDQHKLDAAQLLFGEREDYDITDYVSYLELELVLHSDNRFSVWGNLENDADLLRDTHPDQKGNLLQILTLADEVIEEG